MVCIVEFPSTMYSVWWQEANTIRLTNIHKKFFILLILFRTYRGTKISAYHQRIKRFITI